MAAQPAATIPAAGNIRPVHEKTFTSCMEQLQEAYVASIASTAGCSLELISRDNYGVDGQIVQPAEPGEEEQLIFVQLKNTTTILPDFTKSSFGFQFKERRHIEHLIKPRKTVKAILLVMVSHPHQSEWTAGTHDSLSLRHCCYWMNLENHRMKAGVASPSVRIDTRNMFTAEALIGMFDRLRNGLPI